MKVAGQTLKAAIESDEQSQAAMIGACDEDFIERRRASHPVVHFCPSHVQTYPTALHVGRNHISRVLNHSQNRVRRNGTKWTDFVM